MRFEGGGVAVCILQQQRARLARRVVFAVADVMHHLGHDLDQTFLQALCGGMLAHGQADALLFDELLQRGAQQGNFALPIEGRLVMGRGRHHQHVGVRR